MKKSFMDIDKQNDEAVLMHSVENDPDAFEVIVDRYQKAFIRKALSILRNRTDAEDVVQETFVRIYSAGKRFKKVEGASFSSWAYTILERQCYTLYNKRKRRGVTESEIFEDFFETRSDEQCLKEASNYTLREDLLLAISKLPESFRDTIKSYFLDGKSHEMVAAEYGISNEAARTRLCRAKSLLKKILEKEEDFYER